MAVRSRRIWFCTLYETQHVEANDAKLVEHAGVDNSFSSILSLTLSDEHYLSDLEESVYYTFHLFCLFFLNYCLRLFLYPLKLLQEMNKKFISEDGACQEEMKIVTYNENNESFLNWIISNN